jgi:hypothetical protein
MIAAPLAGLAAEAKAIPASYEGGSLAFDRSKVTATLGAGQVILMQHGHRIAIPAGSITRIDCATDTHRRFGAMPYMHLGETGNHYVGVAWTNAETDAQTPTVEALFKLNRSEYAAFLSGLERMTGKQAIDTNQTRTAVRY